MNRALLELFGANDNTQITGVLRDGGLGGRQIIGSKMLAALWHGTASIKFETNGFTRTGQPVDLLFRMDMPRDAGNELDPSRALISLTDLTERTRRIFDQAAWNKPPKNDATWATNCTTVWASSSPG